MLNKFLLWLSALGAFLLAFGQTHAWTLTGAINGVAGWGTDTAISLLDWDLGSVIKLIVWLAILWLVVYAVKSYIKK
jgi:hypothetical protein